MTSVIPLLVFFSLANPSQAATHDAGTSFQQIAKQADAARSANRPNDAIDSYAQGVRLRPSWSEGWWWLGSLLYDQERFAEAQPAFKRFIETGQKTAPGYAFLGLCEYETRDYDHALAHFQVWAKKGSPGNDALLDVAGFHWALLLTREGRFNEALYLLAAKAEKLRSSPPLVEAMGLASLRMKNLPEDYPPEKREVVWLAGQAAYYSAINANRQAVEYANRLLLHHSFEPNVHFFRGTLFAFQKEPEVAQREFQEELRISPESVPSMIELAIAYNDDSQAEEALPLAERAISLEPRNPRAHYALGAALLATGHAKESATQLEMAKLLAPDSAFIRFSLAKAYRALGRSAEANRESAAFLALKDKQEVLGTPREKPAAPKQAGPKKL